MKVHRLLPGELARYGPRIAALERDVRYPLGADRFRIDHGRDYFAFFSRLRGGMGHPPTDDDLRYYVARDGEEIRGVLAAVRRIVPARSGVRAVWYLCDLKAAPGAPAAGVMPGLLAAFRTDAFRAPRAAYAVSMNAADGSNRLVALAARYVPDLALRTSRLSLFSLDHARWRATASRIRSVLGVTSFLSLAGIKDIVLESDDRPLELLHLQHGPLAAPGNAEPSERSVIMFCAPDSSRLVEVLRREGIAPNATATYLAAGIDDVDPAFVSTSEI
jgi:hypothetical protein